MAKIINYSDALNNINQITKILNNNDIVVLPTDTLYGLIGNGLNENVINKIKVLKNRTEEKAFILLAADIYKIENIISRKLTIIENEILNYYWPGEITFILDINSYIPTSLNSTAALRIPKNELLEKILNKIDFPLAAPSANPSGEKGCEKIENIIKWYNNKVKCIVNNNDLEFTPSTLVRLYPDGKYNIIRHGRIDFKYPL